MPESRNKVISYILKGGMTIPLGDYSRLKIVISDELNEIKTNNYTDTIWRNNASVTLSAEKLKGKRFGGVVLLRQTLDDKSLLVPDFSAGFEYRIISGEEHYMKLNISRNSKIPSLNDLFWNPGGNHDLKNEHAYSYEIGYKSGQKILPGLTLNSEVNFYNNYIRDMIQWHPVNDTLWMADNIENVNSKGVEFSVNVKYMLNDLSVDLNAGYSYTRAFQRNKENSDASMNQLIYIPKNTANGSVRFTYRNIYTIWGTTFTGKTFTIADNTKFLTSYTLNNLTGGTKLSLGKNIIDLNFRIDNIFNVVYQSIEYYPRPGRSYFLTFSLRFRK
jgi:iron complex outermembrane receptor protein